MFCKIISLLGRLLGTVSRVRIDSAKGAVAHSPSKVWTSRVLDSVMNTHPGEGVSGTT